MDTGRSDASLGCITYVKGKKMDKKRPVLPAPLDTISEVTATYAGVKIVVTQCPVDDKQFKLIVFDSDTHSLFKTIKSEDLDDLLERQYSLLRGFAH